MRQSRGRGSKVETEARPCEAEARPSQLKKLPRGRVEPRQQADASRTTSLLSMTLSDLWPGFQGRDIFEVEYRKNGAS